MVMKEAKIANLVTQPENMDQILTSQLITTERT